MAAAGHRPGIVAFTALLSSASKLGPDAPHSAGVACLLRQMLTAEDSVAGTGQEVAVGDAAASVESLLDRSLQLLDERKEQKAKARAAAAMEGELSKGDDGGLLADGAGAEELEGFDKTLGMVDFLGVARVHPTPALWNRLFDEVLRRSQLARALKRYKRLRPRDEEQSPQVAHAISAARRRVEANEHVVSSPQLLPADAMVHQPFLSESHAPPKPELVRAFQVFNEMRASGVYPDRAAYNALINVCSSAADIPRAAGAFGEMVAAGIKPDVISYTSLIKAHAVAGDAAGAESIFHEMEQRTNHFTTFTPPSSHTFAHLMAVQHRAGNATRVLLLLEDMRLRGLRPAIAHFSYALQASAESDASCTPHERIYSQNKPHDSRYYSHSPHEPPPLIRRARLSRTTRSPSRALSRFTRRCGRRECGSIRALFLPSTACAGRMDDPT